MSTLQPNSGTAWTTVVARGLKAKVPAPIRKVDQNGKRDFFSTKVIFEDPEIAAYTRSQQVHSIIHSALSPSAVVFDFPAHTFENRTDAYRAILTQLGSVVGDRFNPVSLRDTRPSGNLLLSAVFRDPDVTLKAIESGITIDSIQHKAVPYKDTTSNGTSLIKVNLTIHTSEEEDELIPLLKSSLGNYGKVCQIKKLLYQGFFEGEISVLLDRSSNGTQQQQYHELTRMLYLESWDTFSPASFKGAQPICYYCRQAGHVKKDCPSLLKLSCFRCGETGHTKRRCRKNIDEVHHEEKNNYVPRTFDEELAAYEQLTAASKTVEEELFSYTNKDYASTELSASDNEVMKQQSDEVGMSFEDEQVPSEEAEPMELSTVETNRPTEKVFIEGLSASKYAPMYIRSTMDIDNEPSVSAPTSGRSTRATSIAKTKEKTISTPTRGTQDMTNKKSTLSPAHKGHD